jgi:hypothetical protein
MWGIRVIIIGWLLAVTGCGLWSEELAAPSQLPPLRPAPNRAMLDMALIGVPADHAGVSALWQDLDEQHVSTALRQRLAENGIRCGLLGQQLPPSVEQLIETSTQQTTAQTGFAQGVTIQRMTFSPGAARQLAATGIRDEMIVLHSRGESVSGNTYQAAQCLLDIRCDHAPGDRVRLAVIPEIHHGEPRRHVGGSQGALQFIVRKDKVAFDELTIETELAIGQTLVLGATDPPKGLGTNFFLHDETGQRQTKLLLIRLVQAPHEPLFPAAPADPLPLADDWL